MKIWHVWSFLLFVVLPLGAGGIYYCTQTCKTSSWDARPQQHVDDIKAVIERHPGSFKPDDRKKATQYIITPNAKKQAINLFKGELCRQFSISASIALGLWIVMLLLRVLSGQGSSKKQPPPDTIKIAKSRYVSSIDLTKVLLGITGVIISVFGAAVFFRGAITLTTLVAFTILIVDLVLGLFALSMMNGAIVKENNFEVEVKSDLFEGFWWLTHFQFFYLLLGIAEMVGGLFG